MCAVRFAFGWSGSGLDPATFYFYSHVLPAKLSHVVTVSKINVKLRNLRNDFHYLNHLFRLEYFPPLFFSNRDYFINNNTKVLIFGSNMIVSSRCTRLAHSHLL
jgi:hypothetical protein